MSRMVLWVDFQRCIACRACELACEAVHDGGSRIHVILLPGVSVPLTCRQCERSPCALVCPEDALLQTEQQGVVFVPDRCTRCGLCVPACPFGVLEGKFPEKVELVKCDLCQSHGPERPACVITCPTGVLQIQKDHTISGKRRRSLKNLGFPARGKEW